MFSQQKPRSDVRLAEPSRRLREAGGGEIEQRKGGEQLEILQVAAADGFEGIEKAILLRPDAIVMDLSMPQLDGFETVRVLRGHERTRQIPVLALTGAMLDSEGRAHEEGFSAFLRKPCLPQYLLHELRRFLP